MQTAGIPVTCTGAVRRMGSTIVMLLPAVAIGVAIKRLGLLEGILGGRTDSKREQWPLYARRLLSPNEQKCYHRLRSAFPDHFVMAQVSLSQVLGVKKGQGSNRQAIFNRFRQLTADFVVCNKDFSVAAVFELDDGSHDAPRRQDSDSRKAAALAAAGVPLHRLNSAQLPNEAALRQLSLRTSV
jgi:very-short-patch-repair endonuclease